MPIQAKRFNWVRAAPAWKQFQVWQQKRRAMREQFDTAQMQAREGFAAVWSNQITEGANLAAEAALNRVRKAAKAKLDRTA